MGWDGMGWDGIGLDGMRWDGKGSPGKDGIGYCVVWKGVAWHLQTGNEHGDYFTERPWMPCQGMLRCMQLPK